MLMTMNIYHSRKGKNGITFMYKAAKYYSKRAASYSTGEYDLLQRTILPMNHFQKSLPRLAVPKLDDTINRYLLSQEAYLSKDEFDATKKHVDEFRNGMAPSLQTSLEQFAAANKHTSYVTGFWFDMYLKDRRPVVLTHNPVMTFNDSKLGADYNQQVLRAANMVFSSIRFLRSCRAELLEPDVYHLNPSKSDTETFRRLMRLLPTSVAWYGAYLYKAFPLDMSQFANLFSSSRIPRPGKDELKADPSSRHLLVIHKAQMYVFDVLDSQGRGISPKQLLSNLQHIVSQPVSSAGQQRPGLGLFTTLDRDTWCSARERLLALGNKETLGLVDTALFALVLDNDPMPDVLDLLHSFLHGPAESRWFDKSLSLLVNGRGQAAVNFEHSWGDGVAVLRYFNEVCADADANPTLHPPDLMSPSLPAPDVRRLEFQLDDALLQETLPRAKQDYDSKRNRLALTAGQQEGLGKHLCKEAGVSADAVMQLAFQMAHYKVHNGAVGATYESCSTAAFKHGRTETIRSATKETREFCRVASKAGGADRSAELFHLLQQCSTKHSQLTREAAMGQGWDRHLFGLRQFLPSELKSPPSLFADPNYARINQIVLSTSTLSSPSLLLGAFAPVTPDGYGIGYAIKDDSCGCLLSTWSDARTARGPQFADAFTESCRLIATVLQYGKQKKQN